MALVDIVVTVRSAKSNPWLDRLVASLNAFRPGVPVALLLEDGEDFTRVEKRLRVLRRSSARYLCLHGSTLISTPEGDIPIQELVGRRDAAVYCLRAGELAVAKLRRAAKTRRNAALVRVRFRWQSGQFGRWREGELLCTPDHGILLKSGVFVEARQLAVGDRLEPFYRRRCFSPTTSGWWVALAGEGNGQRESRFVYEQTRGIVLGPNDAIHHINSDHFDNCPKNLQCLSSPEHARLHWKDPDYRRRCEESFRMYYKRRGGKPEQAEINRQTWGALTADERQEKLTRMLRGLSDAASDGRLSERSSQGWETRRVNGNGKMSVSQRRKISLTMRDQYANGARTSPSLRNDVKAKISASLRERRGHFSDNHEVLAVEPIGRSDVFCLDVPGARNFVANGVFVHNCIMEDDTEVIHDGWLALLLAMMTSVPGVACVSPQETRAAVPEAGLVYEGHAELLMVPGFCFLLDREAKPWWDVRVQTMDDLYLSLRLRSRGWRLGVCGQSVVRHTKQPWASDDLPPHMQADRSRFGAGADYYDPERHERKRLQESMFLIRHFGELARQTIPKELMACIQSRGADEAVLLREMPDGDGWTAYAAQKASRSTP